MKRTLVVGALVLAGALTLPLAARAQTPACDTLPNPVYVSGSTAIKSALQTIAAQLYAATGTDQLTIVYAGSGSCTGVLQIAADTTPTGACISGACVTGTATYWTGTASSDAHTCNLTAGGNHIDVTLSDVFDAQCPGSPDLSLVEDTPFVVLPFGFIVPTASSAVSIDTREGYFVYGFGPSAGMVAPWTNDTTVFQRDMGSGTQVTISRSIHVPEGSFMAVPAIPSGGTSTTTGEVINRVTAGSPADATLGFAGTDTIDLHRGTLTTLAYRHWGQTDFWWPDSDQSTFDKVNVRDGHYPVWGYEHADIRVASAGGTAISARAQQFVDVMTGTRPLPGTGDLAAVFTSAHLVPECAMSVSRATDGADFTAYTPTDPCNCFFEANVPSGSTSCTSCTSDSMCTGGTHCHHGYCE